MKSINGSAQRNNYFVNGLSNALKKQQKEEFKINQEKAELINKKKKVNNFNPDIEIYAQAEESLFAEAPLNIK